GSEMRRGGRTGVAFLVCWLAAGVAGAQPVIKPGPASKPSKEGIDFFEKKIRPVLVHNCYKCHSGDVEKAKVHFVLDTHDGLRKGGDSGEAIAPNHPE